MSGPFLLVRMVSAVPGLCRSVAFSEVAIVGPTGGSAKLVNGAEVVTLAPPMVAWLAGRG